MVLANFDVHAGDGHFHAAAAHDPRDAQDGCKDATGHFFSLNLRSRALAHLTVAEQAARRKEHDMRALKRLSIASLRQGAAHGRKVFYVWDRAGIDFQQWQRWKQGGGVCFLSREKSNMQLEVIGQNRWERADPRNAGVLGGEDLDTATIRRSFCRAIHHPAHLSTTRPPHARTRLPPFHPACRPRELHRHGDRVV